MTAQPPSAVARHDLELGTQKLHVIELLSGEGVRGERPLIGDDLSDFIPCVRKKVVAPCTEAATAASRQRQVELYSSYWGSGWYVLPNPMHGSWTTVE